jgi:tricorn protease
LKRTQGAAVVPLLLGFAVLQPPAVPPRVIESATISRDRIAFAWSGRIWEVARAGGEARAISASREEIRTVAYSPDGTKLAYATSSGVWVIPAGGGEPRRLTFHPRSGLVRGWSADGSRVLYLSMREGDIQTRLYQIAHDGGPETPLPWTIEGIDSYASWSPDGRRLALVPWSPFFGRVDWRYYRGGTFGRLWLVDPSTDSVTVVSNGPHNAIFPMWLDHRVFFLSDSGGSFNLAEYDTRARRTRLHTRYRDHGVIHASLGGGAIALVRNGRIQVFDPATAAITEPAITVPVASPELEPRAVVAAQFVQAGGLSPGGRSAVFEARGEIVMLDSAGTARNLTETPGVAERRPAVSPDGGRVAYFSDAPGEYGLVIRDLNGGGNARRIEIEPRPTFYREPTWSPDGRRLTFSDQRLRLWLADLGSSRVTVVDSSRYIAQGEWRPTWSPDGRWLAYAKANPRGTRAVWLYDSRAGRTVMVSAGGAHDESPVFDRSGRFLYFTTSSNARNAPASDLSWGLLSSDLAEPLVSKRVMAVVLRRGDAFPGPADRVEAAPPSATTTVDLEGLARRAVAILAQPRDVAGLAAGPPGSVILESRAWPETPGGTEPPASKLMRIDITRPQQPVPIAERALDWSVSGDGSALLLRVGSAWRVRPTGDPKDEGRPIDLTKVTIRVDPASEWRQLHREAWRMMRDYFYDPSHHGRDVAALERNSSGYLASITRRVDLNTLIRLGFGEVSVSHLQVGGGDIPRTQPEPVAGLLGADYAVDRGRYRITAIVPSMPYTLSRGSPSPLDQPGVDVSAGDYLISVDGTPITADRDVHAHFLGKVNRPVKLEVSADPTGAGARTVVVTPTAGENRLRRYQWVESRRRMVDSLSGGRLAYVYVEGWNDVGIAEIFRVMNGFPDARGLIIDQRFNGGGTTADAVVEAMLRTPLYEYRYRSGAGFRLPTNLIEGPKVVIIHQMNGSAAETFPLMVKERRAATLVGMRTFGGGIGAALFQQQLIDGGRIGIPNRAAFNSRLGSWDIENKGIEPDVVVEPTLADYRTGRDRQLERAVAVALDQLRGFRKAPRKVPDPPTHPGTARP